MGGKHDVNVYNPGKQQPTNVKARTYENLVERKYIRKYIGDGNGRTGERAKILFAINKLSELENADDDNDNDRDRIDSDSIEGTVDNSNSKTGYDDEPTIEIDASKYPFLNKLDITVNSSNLYALLREIRSVSKEHSDQFKFEYQIDSEKRRELIVVPQVSTDASFNKHAKPVLKNLAKSFVSDTYCKAQVKRNCNSDDIYQDEEKIMVRRIIEHYCTSHEDVFVDVANDNGLNFENKKMSEHYAAAMFAESGIGPTKGRIINRYLTAFFGRRVMPSENNIFRDELALDDLPPETETKVLHDNKKVRFYVKPLQEILKKGMTKKLRNVKKDDVKKIEAVDISWSADHGGGFFRAIVKCSLRFTGNDQSRIQFSHRVGQMQCKSDKYDLVAETMGPKLNAGITHMLHDDRKTSKEIKVYYKTQPTARENDNEGMDYYITHGTDDDYANDNSYIHIATVPSNKVNIAITGDLAFYSIMLGKPNMDSKWCAWCDAACKEWASTTDKVIGQLWSRDTYMRKLRDILQNPRMTANQRKGVKFKPILDVDPTLFVPPPLHIKLGLVNRAFIKPDGNSYFSWSQIRVENIPPPERIAFNMYRESLAILDDRLEDVIICDLQYPKADLDALIENLNDRMKQLRRSNLTEDAKSQLQEEKATLKQEIDEHKAHEKGVRLAVKTARKRKTELKKVYEEEKKKRTYHSRMIQNKKENVLKELGIDRGAAHGGDLQGRGCTNLLQRADKFFDKCLEIDLEAVQSGFAKATAAEVRLVNRHFRQLAIIMDQLIQYINYDHEQIDKHEGNFIQDLDEHIKVYVWFWNYLRLSLVAPKFHIVKDHLVDFFELWHAIGPYNEEFTESDHVKGNAEVRMYGGLRDIQSREESISKRQAVMNHPKVQLVIKKISPTKGKRKRMSDDTRESIEKRRCDVLQEVLYLKLQTANSEKNQISDYWNFTTDER